MNTFQLRWKLTSSFAVRSFAVLCEAKD